MKSTIKTLAMIMLIAASLSGPGRAQAAEFPESREWWQAATPAQIERLLADGAELKADGLPCTVPRGLTRTRKFCKC